MRLIAGTKLGRYKIPSKIGEVGMGEVYFARLAEPRRLLRRVSFSAMRVGGSVYWR
jgi:hypothetical protein